jgi:hypothetical protein
VQGRRRAAAGSTLAALLPLRRRRPPALVTLAWPATKNSPTITLRSSEAKPTVPTASTGMVLCLLQRRKAHGGH